LYPATVDVLAVQPRLTLCCGGAVPVPDTEVATGGLVALLANVIVADAAPLACGAKINVKFALWPALRVMGSDSPLRVNSELVEDTDEIVTPAPLAVRVPD
jgi:hypothetical protein